MLRSHGFTPAGLAELEEMYSDELANDYDIVKYVEKFSTDDTIYEEYATKFERFPDLNGWEIHSKTLQALPGFESLSVKTVGALRWDSLPDTCADYCAGGEHGLSVVVA